METKFIFITAMASSDYDSLSSAVIFASGSNDRDSECVNVTITEDSVFETNETFTLTLTTLDPNVMLGNNVTTITVVDTDGEQFIECLVHFIFYATLNFAL